jgi:acyltransferase
MEMEPPRMRDRSIDIAKGIGIILVVLGHTAVPRPVRHFIFTFHMPLFFVLAGYTFNLQKYTGEERRFIIQKAQRLLRPYFVACAFFYPFWLLVSRHFGPMARPGVPLIVPFGGILYATFWSNHQDLMIFNGPLWFLPTLFVAEVFFLALMSWIPGPLLRWPALVAVSALGIVAGRRVGLPWGVDIALAMQGFMLVGYTLRQKRLLEVRNALERAAWIVLSAIGLVYCHRHNLDNVVMRNYGNGFIFYAGGILGTLLTLHASKVMAGLRALAVVDRALAFTGKHSLTIMIFHVFAFWMFSIVGVFGAHVAYKTLVPTYWPLFATSGVLIPLLIARLMETTVLGTVFYGKARAE